MERIEESQMSSSASIHRIYTDMHQLAGSLLDIILALEERVELLLERSSGDGVQRASPEHKDTKTRDRLRNLLPSREAGGDRWLESDAFKGSKSRQDARQDAEPAHIPLKKLELESVQPPEAVHEIGNSDREKLKGLASRSLSPNADSLRGKAGGVEDSQASQKGLTVPETTDRLIEINTKIGAIDRKLEQIAISMGVRGVNTEGDDEEDRKRLKEKLKQAIEADRRSRIRTIVSRSEVWLEYMFGICRPDQRLGKRGSRFSSHFRLAYDRMVAVLSSS